MFSIEDAVKSTFARQVIVTQIAENVKSIVQKPEKSTSWATEEIKRIVGNILRQWLTLFPVPNKEEEPFQTFYARLVFVFLEGGLEFFSIALNMFIFHYSRIDHYVKLFWSRELRAGWIRPRGYTLPENVFVPPDRNIYFAIKALHKVLNEREEKSCLTLRPKINRAVTIVVRALGTESLLKKATFSVCPNPKYTNSRIYKGRRSGYTSYFCSDAAKIFLSVESR